MYELNVDFDVSGETSWGSFPTGRDRHALNVAPEVTNATTTPSAVGFHYIVYSNICNQQF